MTTAPTRAQHQLIPSLLLLLSTSMVPAGAVAQGGEVQNLVPNGSFEEINREPTTFDQLSRAQGWDNVTIGMAELFSTKASVKTVGIPENFYGSIEPQDGERYAGFFAWKDDQRRDYDSDPEDPFRPGWSAYSEYPWITLPRLLKEGQEYEVSFHVALAGNSDRAVAGIGAYLSPLKLNYQNRSFLRERSQVVEVKILKERNTWVEIKGRFKAEGNEEYLIIGTFPTAIFDTERIIEGHDNQFAYYYLDNVVLREVHGEEAGE